MRIQTWKYLILSTLCSFFFAGTAQSNDTISVFAPSSIWAQAKGSTLEGPVIDLASKIFSEIGLKTEPKALPWPRAIHYIESGELDVILTIFHTEARTKIMEFSIPYVAVPTVVFVAKGKLFPFETLTDLVGLNGLTIIGSSISKELHQFTPKLNLIPVLEEEQMIQMLDRGRADYAVSPKYIFMIKAIQLGYKDKVEALPTPIDSTPLRFAFSKKSPFLKFLPQVNERIQQYQQDGTINKMVDQAIDQAASQ
ncbi:MAG: transporter substrate-binding domain-containing protein [SAR324 cluster bacterium]|nr:transporter substrate-binding domain-containing protein [SAR324 cluster bacterium]